MSMAHALRAWLHLLGTEPRRRCRWRAQASPRPRRCRRQRPRARAPARAARSSSTAAGATAARALEDVSIAYPRDAAGAAGRPPGRLLHRRLAHAARPHRACAAGLVASDAGLPRGARHARLRPGGDRRLRAAERTGPRGGRARAARRLGPARGRARAGDAATRRRDGIAWMRANPAAWSTRQLLRRAQLVAPRAVPPRAGDIDEVLRCSTARSAAPGSGVVLDLVDAERAAVAAARCAASTSASAGSRSPTAGRRSPAPATTPSTTLHAVMAFVGAGRDASSRPVLAAQRAALAGDGDNAAFTARGRPAGDAGDPGLRARRLRDGRARCCAPIRSHRPPLRRQPRAARPDRPDADRGRAARRRPPARRGAGGRARRDAAGEPAGAAVRCAGRYMTYVR